MILDKEDPVQNRRLKVLHFGFVLPFLSFKMPIVRRQKCGQSNSD
jgi:hypothetical protein